MRKLLWCFAGLVLVLCVLGMVLAPKSRADDLDAFRQYAVIDSTNYYRAADINRHYSAMLGGGVATHSIAIRFMEARYIPKRELFELLDQIRNDRGWKRTSRARFWLLQSATGSQKENSFVVEQLNVIFPGNVDFDHLPDDAKVNCEITESRYLSGRDELRLTMQHFGKDPFFKP